MNFRTFEQEAHQQFDAIPKRYREGIDGLTVCRPALPHPRFAQIWTLGECATEAYPSGWDGPETIRSVVLLHWGSFAALAALDPKFDWREQIWETLTHELRHHLESLADRDDLGGVDYAMEQDFRRHDGADFDPLYYRQGDRIDANTFAVEDLVFIEQVWRVRHFVRADALRFAWGGRTYRLNRPGELGDVHFVRILGGPPRPPHIEVVLVRKSAWWERVRDAASGKGLAVLESETEAREAGTSA